MLLLGTPDHDELLWGQGKEVQHPALFVTELDLESSAVFMDIENGALHPSVKPLARRIYDQLYNIKQMNGLYFYFPSIHSVTNRTISSPGRTIQPVRTMASRPVTPLLNKSAT